MKPETQSKLLMLLNDLGSDWNVARAFAEALAADHLVTREFYLAQLAELKGQVAELKGQVARLKTELIRWQLGSGLVVLVGVGVLIHFGW